MWIEERERKSERESEANNEKRNTDACILFHLENSLKCFRYEYDFRM